MIALALHLREIHQHVIRFSVPIPVMANLRNVGAPSKPPLMSKRKNKLDKYSLNIVKNRLLSRTGKLKKKSKDNLKILDDILKSELLVGTRRTRSKFASSAENNVNNNQAGVNNNNNEALTSLCRDTSDLIFKKPLTKTYNGKKRGRKANQVKPASSVRDIDIPHTKEPTNQEKSISNEKDLNKNKQSNAQLEEIINNKNISKDINTQAIKQFECDHCKKIFDKKSRLQRHVYIHSNVKPHKCKHCKKQFRHPLKRQVHIVKKHVLSAQIEMFICDLCNKPFLLKENLSLHLSNHTKGVGFYKCAFCDKKFSNHYYLTEHESHHLKTSKYKCPKCNARFINRSRLILHVKTHKNVKDFICQYCGKEFLRPHSIRRHVEICHSGFRVQCPICHKKLKGHLTEHLRTHEKSKPHKCPDCGQRFTQSTQLTVHRRSHTGAKPYECRICKKTFSHSNAMLLHFRRHTGEKPFQCAMCPMAFTQLPHMKTHMNKIHGRAEAYKCHKCNEFFKMKKEIDNHLKTCLGEADLTIEDKVNINIDAPELHSVMSLSRMRFLLALLLTMVASKSRLKCLGFNKRLIDDLLIESLEAMGHKPNKDPQMPPLLRLKFNIEMLLVATIPQAQMKKFRDNNKTMEEILELLTDDKTSCTKIL